MNFQFKYGIVLDDGSAAISHFLWKRKAKKGTPLLTMCILDQKLLFMEWRNEKIAKTSYLSDRFICNKTKKAVFKALQ